MTKASSPEQTFIYQVVVILFENMAESYNKQEFLLNSSINGEIDKIAKKVLYEDAF
jgi:hypothetical protein